MSTLRQVAPSPPRTPLQNTTNTMGPETSSPPFHTAKTSQSTRSRRKFSIPFFRHQNLDSSESVPSPHSSLWDAPLAEPPLNTTLPVGDWDASGSDLPPPPAPSKRKKKGKRKAASGTGSPPAAISSVPLIHLNPNIHHPHLLDTITERSSRPTLRSHHPSIPSLLQGSSSITTLRARTSALRKESFSLGDLPPDPHSLPSSTKSSLALHNDFIQPLSNAPQYDPPERMPTPPGLPSFNTPEAINYRLPSPDLRFRDHFRAHPTPEQIQYHRQTSRLPPGVVMRGENGELIRGRWRQGGLSGHTGYGTQGALEGHPFTRAPLAEIVTEGDEAPVASGSGPVAGIGPAEEQQVKSRPRQARKSDRFMDKWDRFVVTTCFVCCGVEHQDVEQVRQARGRDGEAVVPRGSHPRFMVPRTERNTMRGDGDELVVTRRDGSEAVVSRRERSEAVAPRRERNVSVASNDEGSVFTSRESYIRDDPVAMMSGAIPVEEFRGSEER
ncbi:MAG: hypothetical protein Q9208_008156 [Pyrenodesmia sp. 3 TL-2023]